MTDFVVKRLITLLKRMDFCTPFDWSIVSDIR